MRTTFMLALAPLLGLIPASGQDNPQKQTILFVCEHGSAKSVIAAAHFNRVAEQRSLPYRAIARGINPDAEVPQQVRVNLAKDGLEIASWKPQKIAEKDVQQAVRIVTFGCKVPFPERLTAGKLVDWQDVPSTNEDYQRARTMLVNKIDALIKTLMPKI